MEEVELLIFKLTKEEACKLDHQQVLIANSLTETSSIEWSDSKNFIARSKYASEYLRYFTFEKPKFKPGEIDNANSD